MGGRPRPARASTGPGGLGAEAAGSPDRTGTCAAGRGAFMLVPVSDYARVKNLVSGIEQTAADGLDRAFERLHAAAQTSGEHGVLAVSVGGGQGRPRRTPGSSSPPEGVRTSVGEALGRARSV